MENKEKKKFKVNVTLILVILFSAITIAGFVISGYLYGENSVFNKNITNNVFLNTAYHKVPALYKAVQIVTIAYLLNLGLSWLLSKLLARSNKGKTIVRLVNSFVKYLIAIVSIFLILAAFGVDTGALLASAGIIGLVVGLGAQSLIADIIAGIFIVFEGEFQVGDIIVVGDWRGTVEEIGIRTTKIIDAGGNVKIINNSEISSVINQTKELSLAKAYISIEYGESIQRVEMVIKENLNRIHDAIPEIVEGPYYKGVDSLSDSSVDLFFVAKCKEEDIYGVQRAMNRELKILFDENNINIPFPQVTVNEPVKFETKVTKKMNKEASSFVTDQRELSKDLEDKK